MDSPLEACSLYLQHFEPYLKDPVGFPRVMVTNLFIVSVFLLPTRSGSIHIESQLLSDSYPRRDRTPYSVSVSL